MRRRGRRPRITLLPPIRRAARGGSRKPGLPPLAASALLFLLSLGLVVRVSAMPAEARTQETWYAYSHELSYDFTARVTPGVIYSRNLVSPDDLLQTQLPQEPPVLRRVVVGALAESVRIALPYHFTADRPARLRASYQVDGEIRVPGLWRRPYPLAEPRAVTVEAAELRLDDLAVQIPLREILDDVARLNQELNLPYDQVQVKIRPVIQLEVEGQREPVATRLEPEFSVVIRNGGLAVEIDEPRKISDARRFESDERVPLSMDLWGVQVPVARVRMGAYGVLGLFALVLVAGLHSRWRGRKREPVDGLRRLGAGLVRANSLVLPEGITLVEVPRLEQLLHLHLQTERPVLQVGSAYYLLDGSACYRYLNG